MTVADRPGLVRPIETLRGLWGVLLLLAPRFAIRTFSRGRVDERSVVILRVLGGRQVAQAALSGLRPSGEVLALGVWVDVAHALTAAGLSLADSGRRRVGVADTVVATTWAAIGYRDLTTRAMSPAVPDHVRDRSARWALQHLPGGGWLGREANPPGDRVMSDVRVAKPHRTKE